MTRDPSKPNTEKLRELGVTLVKGDLNDIESVRRALKGCVAAFLVTNWWETSNSTAEEQQARNFADACKGLGVKHLIMSTLEDVEDLTNGKLKVDHFDGKGRAYRHIQQIGQPASGVKLAFYMENFGGFFKLKRVGQNEFELPLPMGEHRLDLISVNDIGPVVARMLASPEEWLGACVGLAGDSLTGYEIASVLTEVLGASVRYRAVSIEDTSQIIGKEMAAMFHFYQDNAGRLRDVSLSRTLNPRMKTFSQWAWANQAWLRKNILGTEQTAEAPKQRAAEPLSKAAHAPMASRVEHQHHTEHVAEMSHSTVRRDLYHGHVHTYCLAPHPSYDQLREEQMSREPINRATPHGLAWEVRVPKGPSVHTHNVVLSHSRIATDHHTHSHRHRDEPLPSHAELRKMAEQRQTTESSGAPHKGQAWEVSWGHEREAKHAQQHALHHAKHEVTLSHSAVPSDHHHHQHTVRDQPRPSTDEMRDALSRGSKHSKLSKSGIAWEVKATDAQQATPPTATAPTAASEAAKQRPKTIGKSLSWNAPVLGAAPSAIKTFLQEDGKERQYPDSPYPNLKQPVQRAPSFR